MSNPDRPFGWRKRIGLLSPTVIETAAYDFYRLAPDGVSMCATTSNIEHWSRENFQQHVLDPIVTAVRYLASRHVDYIIHTGMPVVTTRGKGFEDELVKQIEDATGLPATTSIRSAIRALAHLGVRNVAVVTPYPQELHQSALAFLAASAASSPNTPWTSSSNGCRMSRPRRFLRPPNAFWLQPRRRMASISPAISGPGPMPHR